MEIPVRFPGPGLKSGAGVAGLLMVVLLASCAAAPRQNEFVPLDTPAVQFPSGRITLYLIDEEGQPMTRTKVDFAWEAPSFYRTMGFTDNIGRVTFAGVPEVANVSIDHPGGNYSRILLVPQKGTAELRVMLDTYGANKATRNRQRLAPGPAAVAASDRPGPAGRRWYNSGP